MSLAPVPAFAATVTVDTVDGGLGVPGCSFREAIEAAEIDSTFQGCPGTPGTDTVGFDIPGTPPHTIALTGTMATIDAPVTIDGRTEPDYVDSPVVAIDGSAVASDGLRFQSTADGSAVYALSIHSFGGDGIATFTGADGLTFRGNYVGVAPDGETDVGNDADGINAATVNNVVGGPAPEDANVVSGNGGNGVTVGAGSTVEGNLIGTTAAGDAALGNDLNGVWVRDATATVADNVIAASAAEGVEVNGNDVTIVGNAIGTDAAGTVDLGNDGNGILLIAGITGTTIGGSGAGEPNTVAHNDGDGINTLSNTGVGHSFLANSIHDNGELGIDLGHDEVTPNDADDADTGANDFQNFPVITDVTTGGTTTVEGELHSEASTHYRLDFFVQEVPDPSGFGEGAEHIGEDEVQTEANGDVVFSAGGLGPTAPSEVVTATATELTGAAGDPLSTSEFSEAFHLCTITGTTGDDDPLPGTMNDDIICALGGNDRITRSLGNDVIIGGPGIDTMSYVGAAAALTIDLATGQANAPSTGKTDTLLEIENATGGNEADTMSGDPDQTNTLNGSGGADILDYSNVFGVNVDLGAETGTNDGAVPPDTVISFRDVIGSPASDSFTGVPGEANAFDGNGNLGLDTVNYQTVPGPVTVDLSAEEATDDGDGGLDDLVDIESVLGSSHDDHLTGDGEGNTLNGTSGDDTLIGGGGDDTLTGGSGDDAADYSALPGSIVADMNAGTVEGASVDTLEDVEEVIGTAFDDTFVDDPGLANSYQGGNGTDRVSYAAAPSGATVDLGAGVATADGGGGADALASMEDATGSANGDTLTGSGGANAISGGGGNDTISGAAGIDTIEGGEGNDFANGGNDNDTVRGGEGDDTVLGEGGNDIVLGENGDDVVSGGEGNDTTDAGEGADSVLGEGGDDVLMGLGGNDTLTGGDGNDTATGGGGKDTAVGQGGNDTLKGEGGKDTLKGGGGKDTLKGGGGKDKCAGGGGKDKESSCEG